MVLGMWVPDDILTNRFTKGGENFGHLCRINSNPFLIDHQRNTLAHTDLIYYESKRIKFNAEKLLKNYNIIIRL